MPADIVCPRCHPHELVTIPLFSGRVHSCFACNGVLLDRSVAATLFDGLTCSFEAPAGDGPRCGACRTAMSRLRFTGEAPLLACGAHGVWLDPEHRGQLPPSVRRKLLWRERVAKVLARLKDDGDGDGDGDSGGDGSSGGDGDSTSDCDASGGDAGCGACGGD